MSAAARAPQRLLVLKAIQTHLVIEGGEDVTLNTVQRVAQHHQFVNNFFCMKSIDFKSLLLPLPVTTTAILIAQTGVFVGI